MLTETTANNVRKHGSSVVRNLPLHDARGPRFDPRSRQEKFWCPNTISLVSFAWITLDKCIVLWIGTLTGCSLCSKFGRLKPPPVLTSGFNRLKPPRSKCQKVVNTGQYESEWSIEFFKLPFWCSIEISCQVLHSIYRKKKKILFRPCQEHFLP